MKSIKTFGALAFLAFIIIAVLTSPLFSVGNVSVKGSNKLTDNYILKTVNLDEQLNIFAFRARNAERALKANPYVADVSIKKNLLARTVDINVKERVVCGYVEYMSSYLYIDEDGRVLETSAQMDERLPVVVGFKPNGFIVGNILQFDGDAASFDTLVVLTRLIKKYGLEESVAQVSLKEENNARIYINGIDVELGDTQDADEKIGMVKSIVQILANDNVKGFLDIKDITRPARFKFLT
ncbi:MAG: FtsQ-type POTRA domain-containing protein [Clostridiales bacterium]|nr:FtsQ-type POTRA domain-containing protein [Clostridiales bacterium]